MFKKISFAFLLSAAVFFAQGVMAAESPVDKAIPEHEKAWLNIDGKKSLAYYLSEATGQAYGGVILSPDIATHPLVSKTISSLRVALSDNHWHTLALNTSELNPSQAEKAIAAGIKFLNEQGVFNIAVLGEGSGAAHSIHYLASRQTATSGQGEQGTVDQIRALIMINANNAIPGESDKTLEELATLNLPILDAFSNNDYLEQQLAEQRKKATRKSTNRRYQQIKLPLESSFRQANDNRITKRIRGWLDKNIAGFTVDR